MNNEVVFADQESESWSTTMLVNRILKKIRDDEISALEIGDLKMTTEVTNEALDCLLRRDTPPNGYTEFIISDWYTLKTPLEKTIVDRTLQKLSHVEVF